MANVADTVAVPGSNIKTGDGTNSRTFTLPGSPGMKIQSVVATVDNTAGADTTATLTIKDQSGEVIATQRQDDVIPAADTGTASFALRLGATRRGFIRYNVVNTGTTLDVRATDSMAFAVTGAGQPYSVTTNGGPMTFQSNAGAITIATDGAVAGDIKLFAGLGTVDVRGDTIEVKSTGKLNLRAAGGVMVSDSTTAKVGFFGSTGAVRQGTPVTLADVIALLRAYNLAA